MSAPGQARVRRGGRPKSDNPKDCQKVGYFTKAEERQFNAWKRRHGIRIDNEALRTIILERFKVDGVTDPGPDSEEGRPEPSPWRQPTNTTPSTQGPSQLMLTA